MRMATRINPKEDGKVGVMRCKKSTAPAVIEKILCDNPRRFHGLRRS
jgi:hypothetical protein